MTFFHGDGYEYCPWREECRYIRAGFLITAHGIFTFVILPEAQGLQLLPGMTILHIRVLTQHQQLHLLKQLPQQSLRKTARYQLYLLSCRSMQGYCRMWRQNCYYWSKLSLGSHHCSFNRGHSDSYSAAGTTHSDKCFNNNSKHALRQIHARRKSGWGGDRCYFMYRHGRHTVEINI